MMMIPSPQADLVRVTIFPVTGWVSILNCVGLSQVGMQVRGRTSSCKRVRHSLAGRLIHASRSIPEGTVGAWRSEPGEAHRAAAMSYNAQRTSQTAYQIACKVYTTQSVKRT